MSSFYASPARDDSASSPYTRRTAGAAGRQIVSPSHQAQGQGGAAAYFSPSQPQQQQYPPPPQSAFEEKQAEIEAAEEEQRQVMEALAANKCICLICTCGKHHCPSLVHGQAHYDQNIESLYRETYKRHPLTVSRALAPPSTVFATGDRFAGASVTKSDFVPHVGAKPSPLWQPPPQEAVGGQEQFVKESEARANYKSHGYARREAAIPAHTMHVSNEPFAGQSTTREDFQRWSARPAELIKPLTSAAPTGPDERNFQTESSNFNAKGYVARKPAIPFTSHVFDSSEQFEGESSMKAEFRKWDVKPSESFKREQKAIAPNLLYHA